jgi:hypothetical protein
VRPRRLLTVWERHKKMRSDWRYEHDVPSRATANSGRHSHSTSVVVPSMKRTTSRAASIFSTTLAAAINTPASTVILAEQEFVGEDGRPFTFA